MSSPDIREKHSRRFKNKIKKDRVFDKGPFAIKEEDPRKELYRREKIRINKLVNEEE